jgi:hypothetical protein
VTLDKRPVLEHGDVGHLYEGMCLEDGTSIAWTLCGIDAGRITTAVGAVVTCKQCQAIETAGRILSGRVLAFGPPDLVSSSLPRSLR